MNNYREFYNRLRTLYERHKTLESFKSDFNIFNIISNPYDEVNLHSMFIYSLLTNKIYGEKFFLEFLKVLNIELLDTDTIELFYVEREKVTNDGRIDLFITYTNNEEKYVIAIENKIWAGDQEKQLDRYYEFCKNYCNNEIKNINLIYLTLFGDNPTEESCSNKLLEFIYIVSYKNDITEWMDECIKIVALEPKLREVLLQYKELLIDITGGKNDFTMEIKNIILEDYDNFVIASEVENSLMETKIELQLKFWKELEKSLDELVEKGKLTISGAKYKEIGEFNSWYNEELVRKFYEESRNNKYYGLLYLIKNVKDVGDLYLKVEIDSRYVYFGIRRRINDINISSVKYNDLKEQLNKSNYLSLNNNSWWFGVKHFNFNNLKIDFCNINKDLAKALYEEHLSTLISSCTKQIEELIEIVNQFN